MAGTLKQVRIIRPWKHHSVGAVITPTGGVREYLVNAGYAEVVEAESPARPAKLSHKAAAKLGETASKLSKAAGDLLKH